MLQKFVYSVIIFLIACLLFVLFRLIGTTGDFIYIEHLQEKSQPLSNDEAKKIIEKINKKNTRIKNLSSDSIKIKIQNIPLKLRAVLYYEKQQNFRMIVKSILGKELDIGSNSRLFWFWSKRMNPPNLNYAEYKDLHKTYLKTPLHPLWLMESLGITKIDINSSVNQTGKYVIISEKRLSASNVVVVKKTIIDTEIMAIVGHYLFENGNLVSSTEIKSFSSGVPKEMTMIWINENITMYLNLQNVILNHTIDSNYWNMPSMKNKINLAVCSP